MIVDLRDVDVLRSEVRFPVQSARAAATTSAPVVSDSRYPLLWYQTGKPVACTAVWMYAGVAASDRARSADVTSQATAPSVSRQ